MRKFLVIDDTQDRKGRYTEVFEMYELDFAVTKSEFLEKIGNKYDGYFVDIIYSIAAFEDFSFQQILEKIPERTPIFLISSQWDKAMDQMKMKSLRTSGKASDVLGYLSWTMINEKNQEAYVRDFVVEQTNHYYGMAFEAFGENQDISILQISDIEFGNPGQIDNVETARASLIKNVRKCLRLLNINDPKVDFICICGDVAYNGSRDQYAKAKQWLTKLGEELLVNKNFENMLIVPGNHDYDFNGGAGNFVYYNRSDKAFEPKNTESDNSLSYHEQAMYNFAKFVYELNGETSYLFNPYKPILKRTYEQYGFNFILLNPVRTSSDKEFSYGLVDESMRELIESSEFIEESTCNIVLSHFAPEKYSVIDSTSDAMNGNIQEIADTLEIKGWFYGHAHGTESIDDRKVGENKVLCSRTETLMLKNTQHCEGAGNGFTLFKLSRKKGKVCDISYYDEKRKKEKKYSHLFNIEDSAE